MRRLALTVLLTAALAGCASVRKGLGEYQKAADKGVTIGGPPDMVGPGTSGVAEAPSKKGKRPELPGGLGGDKAHADYTAPQG